MVNERPKQFGGPSRYGSSAPRPGFARPQATGSTMSDSPSASRANKMGLGLGKGAGGLGKGKGVGKGGLKRKIQRDTIYGVTKGDIRRLARRGGVKRISATIYDDVRQALKTRLALILKDCCAIVGSSGRKAVSITDIVFTLRRLGNPIYGFDPSFLTHR